MAGMNRLGSAPKKAPAAPRPVDPHRFKSIESKPQDTDGDLEYQKLVQEVEEGVGSRQAGWLFGRGAFDRTDLQYLKVRWCPGPLRPHSPRLGGCIRSWQALG